MTFAAPQFFWLLLIPTGLLAWSLLRGRRAGADESFPKILRAEVVGGGLAISRHTAPAESHRVRPWLLAGLVLLTVALARPQWGRVDEPVFDQSREIILAIDLSRSMLTPDVKPSRLERAKLLIQGLLEKLEGERVGLVVFSGTAFLQSPLSADYEILREFLPALKPDFLPEGGTNYGALIDTTLDAFGAGTAADRFLIVLSDGEATDDTWQAKVADLKKKGIRMIGLGLGTTVGAMIPDGAGGFVKDERGAVVLSKLESRTLQQLARETNGLYRDASGWVDLAQLVEQTVASGRTGEFVDRRSVRLVERFQWPLALAVWCLLVSLYFEFPVRPKPRAIQLRSGRPGRDASAAPAAAGQAATATSPAGGPAVSVILAGLLVLGAAAPSGHAAAALAPAAKAPIRNDVSPAAPGEPAALGKIVGRLSAKDSLTAPDLAELARETLTWGRRLREAGQPVTPGPVHDALTAVEQLKASGEKLANWEQLESELKELLEKPEEPPQQQQQDDQKQNQDDQKQKQDGKQDQKDSAQQKQDPSKSDQEKSEGEPKSQPSEQSQPSSAPQKQDDKAEQPPAFGDMKKTETPPPPPPTETQKVGGAQEKKDATPPADPTLALPMEKLEQLRNQDSPSKLFQLMQPERSQATQKKPAKDW